MPIEIGHVEAIFRYPVKSMGGERLESAKLGWQGLDGDRRLAFRRIDDRSGFPWLTASKLPDLLLFAPHRREDGAQGDLPTHIRTPDGEKMPVFGEDLATEVGRRYGARDRTTRRAEPGRATISPECCGSFTAIGSLPGGRVVGRCALIRRGGRRRRDHRHDARPPLLDGEPRSRLSKSGVRNAEGGRSCEPEQRGNLRRGHSQRSTGGRTDHYTHNLAAHRRVYVRVSAFGD